MSGIKGFLGPAPSKIIRPNFSCHVARGLVRGWQSFLVYGSRLDVDNTADVDLWQGPADDIFFPAAAGVITLSSTSVNDTAAGSGAQVVLLDGLDTDWNVITEAVPLNGTTPVVSTLEFLRSNTSIVVASGAGDTNEGDITLTHGGSAVSFILAGDSVSLQASFSTARAHRFHALEASTWQGRDNAGTASLRIRPFAAGTWYRNGSSETYRNQYRAELACLAVIDEKTDVRVTGRQVAVGGTTALFTTLVGMLENTELSEV